MRKALYILADLDEADIRWMTEVGRSRVLSDGDVLIEAGNSVPALYIVLDGALSVTIGEDTEVARLGVGDIVGEMSLVEKRPPSVSVCSKESSRVLAIPQSDIRARLDADVAFAARLYRALAVFLSDRLRGTVARLGYGDDASDGEILEAENELDEGLLDTLHIAGERMRRLLALLEQQVTPNG